MTVTVCNQTKDRTEDTHPVGSWGRFARRIYFDPRYNADDNRPNDAIWLYVAISVIYFLLIGVIVAILLLAPKMRPSFPVASSIGREAVPPPDISLADETEDVSVTESKESFQASPKDPLYDIDIDPRSPIFRGDSHRWEEDVDERLRTNSKFLQD